MRWRFPGLLLAIGTFVAVAMSVPPELRTRSGGTLPPFSWTDLDGRVITPDTVRGKVLLVNFWATWCSPCRQEFPSLVSLQARHATDLVIVGMALDDSPRNQIEAFAMEHRTSFPIVIATPAEADLFGGVVGLPSTFVVNRSGRVTSSHTGYATPAMFEAAVQAAMRSDR